MFLELKYPPDLPPVSVSVLEACISQWYGKRGAWVNKPKSRFLIRTNKEEFAPTLEILGDKFAKLEVRDISEVDESLTEEERDWMENLNNNFSALVAKLKGQM